MAVSFRIQGGDGVMDGLVEGVWNGKGLVGERNHSRQALASLGGSALVSQGHAFISFSPTTQATMVDSSRICTVASRSPKKAAPTTTVPTAPIPVQIA